MRTLQEMVAAIDRVLPLCEAVAKAPDDRAARQALAIAPAAIAANSFLEPCKSAEARIQGLCNFVHIQAILLRDCMARLDVPDQSMRLIIDSKAHDLLALLPELKAVIERAVD